MKQDSNLQPRWLLLSAVLLLVTGCLAAPGYRGEATDNFDGEHFFNRSLTEKSPADMMKLGWNMIWEAEAWPRWVETEPREIPPAEQGISVTFINHSTLLLQVDGMTVLTDPIYSKRASPFQWAGPERVHAPGVLMEDLPDIDVILISHNHYDHLDEATLLALTARQEEPPLILAGLGNGLLLTELGLHNHVELNWNQIHQLGELVITFTECRHRSGRGLGDQMQTLWGSFVVEAPSGNIYFAGDTGFDDHFAEAGETFGEFALALLPIGAYEPRWFMADIHLNPLEAVIAHKALNARQSVGIHYGTFQLTFEAVDQPEKDLAEALAQEGVSPSAFRALDVGETFKIR